MSGLDPAGLAEHPIRAAQVFLQYTSDACNEAGPAFNFLGIELGEPGTPAEGDPSPFQLEIMPANQVDPVPGGEPGLIGYLVSIPLGEPMSACDNALATFRLTPTVEGRLIVWFRDPAAPPATLLADDAGGSIAPPQLVLMQSQPANALSVIVDWTEPIATCPLTITVDCIDDVPAPATDHGGFVALGGTASDNCSDGGHLVFTSSDGPLVGGGCGGAVIRAYTITDECGNFVVVHQTIRVNDRTAPTGTAPPPVSVECLDHLPAAATDYLGFAALGGTAFDNCSDGAHLAFTSLDAPLAGGGCGGAVLRTYTITDGCGNSVDVVQTITVNDVTPPTGTAPTIPASVGCLGDLPSPAANYTAFLALGGTASDNCSEGADLTFTSWDAALEGDTVLRTYRMTDECGNFADVDQVITVTDAAPPTGAAPAPVTAQCATHLPAAATSYVGFVALGGTASDNCTAGPNLTVTPSDGPLAGDGCGGTITRTYTITDESGNAAALEQVITVDDTLAPVIACPADVTVPYGASTDPSSTGGATATDNCSAPDHVVIGYSDVVSAGDCAEVYIITRTWTAADACGNLGSCSQIIRVGSWGDCNDNGTPDGCDVSSGASADCNSNRIPDECDLGAGTSLDCNHNGLPDECDIAEGTSQDCTGNGIPDECEPDCNDNGVADSCDVAAGTSEDCNSNGVPDECDVSGGTGADCNGNGVPDVCDIAAGTSKDCNNNRVPDECDIAGGTSADCNGNGVPDLCDIAGGESRDCNRNGVPDACEISSGSAEDCNSNAIPDACDVTGGLSDDCNSNGVPDECDVAMGASADCNGNGVPDECDIGGGASHDCNGNGVPDACDIAGGTSADCTGNGIPDECEPDCNSNDVADSCDIASGASEDCTGNGIPDECEPDCNGNGTADSCDIDFGVSQDCQPNGIPDECDVDSQDPDGDTMVSDDCQPNGIPDECEWRAYDQGGRGREARTSLVCQWPDQQMHGGAFMVPVNWDQCVYAADGFTVGEDTRVDGMRWWGTYIDECGTACEPTDVFVVTFYVSEGGMANRVIGTYDLGEAVERVATGHTIPFGSGFAEYEYVAELEPALAVAAGRRIWVEIRNKVSLPCIWWWETAPQGEMGNGTALYDSQGDGYETGDLVPYDFAFCVAGLPVVQDCNNNGVSDTEDIAVGTSEDCQGNAIPDECETDRNFNGVPDACDIGGGASWDTNFNGVPDEADCLTRPGDMDGDCDVDHDDFALFANCVDRSGEDILWACPCADIDGDGVVNVADYEAFSTLFGTPDSRCRVVPRNPCPETWATGLGGATYYDFGVHGPIPAGFFGAGSDAFGEVVTLVGRPADPTGVHGSADTQIQHGALEFDPATGIATTDVDVITLDLVGQAPITVTYGGRYTEEWFIVVGLSRHNPSPGLMTATLEEPGANAGTFEARVYVQPMFLFIKLQDMFDHVLPECVSVRVLDTGESGSGIPPLPPIELTFVDQPFVRVAAPYMLEQMRVPDCAQGNFVSGIRETTRGGRTLQSLTCLSHETPEEAHYFCPEECQGPDVCLYQYWMALPLFSVCFPLPAYPPAILGGNCNPGTCLPFEWRLLNCEGGGRLLVFYNSPQCVTRASLCQGACWNDEGHCVLSTDALCGGTYVDDTSCDDLPTGACCKPDGACIEVPQQACLDFGFQWQDGVTSCEPNPCELLTGACCLPDGRCTVTLEAFCAGAWQGPESDCEPTGACCLAGGACIETAQSCCAAAAGAWQEGVAACEPNPCAGGACCHGDGTCTALSQQDCEDAGGAYQGDDTACEPIGACCLEDGSCVETTQACCSSATGDWQEAVATCEPNPCCTETTATKLPLGGSLGSSDDPGCFKVYVPTKWGGRLHVTATSGMIAGLAYPDGSPYSNNTETGENAHGWYTFRVTGATSYVVSTTFVQVGQAASTPWNGWYWPKLDTVNPNLYDQTGTYTPLQDYDTVYGTDERASEVLHYSGGEGWEGHCWGWSLAAIAKSQPEATTASGVDFNQDEMEGLYTELAEGATTGWTWRVGSPVGSPIPAGPPTLSIDEAVDDWPDDVHNGLRQYVRQQNRAMNGDLRHVSGTVADQVWNHDVYRYESTMLEAAGGDERIIRITTVLTSNMDTPSVPVDGTARTDTYVYVLEYKADGTIDGGSAHQNWWSCSGFAPHCLGTVETLNWQGEHCDITKAKVDDLY